MVRVDLDTSVTCGVLGTGYRGREPLNEGGAYKMKLIAIASLAAGLVFAGAAYAAPNLITNGDFSSGDTGFTFAHVPNTDPNDGTPPNPTFVYNYVTSPGSNGLVPEGDETIAANPNSVHPLWVSVSGDNPMLLVNGESNTSGDPIAFWQENGLGTGGTYDFSASVMDICCNGAFDGNTNAMSALMFQVSTDGGTTWTTISHYDSQPGPDNNDPDGDEGVLKTITGVFTTSGPCDIRAVDDNTMPGGNDFAIDNIVVTAAPEPATWGLMILGVGMVGGALRFSRKSQRPLVSRIA
jgi:PEP-CTERM motif